MAITPSKLIWKNGNLIPWADATVHLLSTVVQFGTSVFEGLRCYQTDQGPALFRMQDHIQRLIESSRTYRMVPEYSQEELCRACIEVVRANELTSAYVRPMILRGFGAAGLYPIESPIETYVASFPWGAYLGDDGLEKGVSVCVSSWQRGAPNTFPMSSKAGGHYVNAQLIKMEAMRNGYSEGIALGPGGLVSEGSGQNLFMVRDGILITPVLDGTSLRGITRHTVIVLARELGFEVKEAPVPRESLYSAEEMFFTGTAAEVTPITSVDGIELGNGSVGEITKKVQKAFMDLVYGRTDDRWGWLTRVT